MGFPLFRIGEKGASVPREQSIETGCPGNTVSGKYQQDRLFSQFISCFTADDSVI
jgi:hypothetical protein